jgi:hypothetical protein
MAKSLKENEEIELTYRGIREIVGSPSLKVIVDKILTKETTYNDSLSKINELENLIDVYNKDIDQLEHKLKLLKNEQIVQQNDEKTLSTIQSNMIQESEYLLIREEEELIEEEQILKDKLLQINLIYKKIMENIEYFMEEMTIDNEQKKGEKIIKKKYNFDDTNDNFFQQATMAGQSTVYDPNTTKNVNITKTTFNKPNIITPLMTTTNYFHTNESKIKSKTQNRFFSRGSTPKNKIFDEICITTTNDMKPASEKEKSNDNNKILPGFSEKEDSLFDDMSNANTIVKNYNDFLNWLNQKFDKFFLCFNKEQFKAAMAEKGEKNELKNNELKNKNSVADRVGEKRMTKRRKTRKFSRMGTLNKVRIEAGVKEIFNKFKTEDNEVEVDEDEMSIKVKDDGAKVNRFRKRDNKPSMDIFQRFLEEQENKVNEYIHERELRNKNKPKAQS